MTLMLDTMPSGWPHVVPLTNMFGPGPEDRPGLLVDRVQAAVVVADVDDALEHHRRGEPLRAGGHAVAGAGRCTATAPRSGPTFAALRPVSGVWLAWVLSPRRWVQSAAHPAATSAIAAVSASHRPGAPSRRVQGVRSVTSVHSHRAERADRGSPAVPGARSSPNGGGRAVPVGCRHGSHASRGRGDRHRRRLARGVVARSAGSRRHRRHLRARSARASPRSSPRRSTATPCTCAPPGRRDRALPRREHARDPPPDQGRRVLRSGGGRVHRSRAHGPAGRARARRRAPRHVRAPARVRDRRRPPLQRRAPRTRLRPACS